MTMTRREATRICVATLCGAAIVPLRKIYGQTAPAPQFDVSTVKPSTELSATGYGFATGHGRIEATNFTLESCILRAYKLGPHQVAGGPGWVYSDRFDIKGKIDRPIDDTGQIMTMLQSLLADRFKLALHRETRTIAAYVLEVDKKGPKLAKAEGDDPEVQIATKDGRVTYTFGNTDMDSLVQILARQIDLPISNSTKLAGNFNFTLQWTPETAAPSKDAAFDEGSIYTALREQLGLRLRSAEAPMQVLVIDHAERPSPN